MDNTSDHNSIIVEAQDSIDELRRRPSEYKLPFLQQANENNNNPSKIMEDNNSFMILLNSFKRVRARQPIEYANPVARLLMLLPDIESSDEHIPNARSPKLEQQAQNALHALSKFQGTSDALAEVFCLTDPSRLDNPIIFASEEFHRITQYGMEYVLGRNCRFLQGPKTNKHSKRRIRDVIEAGQQHHEVFLDYRRDGSPFMNLLMCAPLCDNNGKVRCFIGVDVSGLVMDDTRMDSIKGISASGHPSPNGQFEEDGDLAHQNGYTNGIHTMILRMQNHSIRRQLQKELEKPGIT
ncbi:white collar, putative [Talaromyces stipitatus ATCC 10500]|uniref:White collar, putative n=1 Tax=Talaromyces stipitatus (strain ATCC 10500 / CBS 375.48 / QM 6759 / NRRL 1006) TaxID=441959 RepID=B8M976_TALSN|nr:white collar, putative [Talaromyces stipitatus ATCC 10500]EED17371.1 white collar, putative [Talaromyces stipitatus ATCC 10500]